ncbi:MAG: NAD(P)H-dependent glycerol-3-phosphate dehydrogenase [Lachnospiraceae bacterium]|nr:NAD(P)H-dependent glycerol-3-phosphate dehydrogenase [Lachnospiraceae bacterium]
MGVTRQAVSKWETGTAVPDIELLVQLSELYGISINDIVKADLTRIKFQKELVFPEKEKQEKKVFVIGCGRWGTFIAWYLDKIGHRVSLYGRAESATMQRLMETGKNDYLSLPDSLELTTSMEGLEKADYIVISVGAQKLREVAMQLAAQQVKDKIVVLCMKGIEIETGRRLSQVASDELNHSNHIAVWLGPGHVQEFYRGVPNCMVIDSNEELVKDELIRSFSSELIRFYYGTDLIGNEIGAAAKNVIGIAAGMLEGFDLSSLKGALMARGTSEIARLIVAMGGNAGTVYGLCHLGDYEATLFSEHSHNLSFGKSFVQGKEYGELAEGYYTVQAIRKLGKAYGVELPICEAVYQIVHEGKEPQSMLRRLFDRSLKNEFV